MSKRLIVLVLGILLFAGCSQSEDRYEPRSLQNLPYRPLNTLIPAEDTWYHPKHTDVIGARGPSTTQPIREKIAGKEHWGHMIHRLQHGDSLYSLARQYYGDAGHWRLILAANRRELSNAHQLPISTFIYLPTAPLKNPDGSMRPPVRRPEYYVIGSGDTLARVARIFLGKTELYKELAQFNHLPNPNQVNAGQLIALPKEN